MSKRTNQKQRRASKKTDKSKKTDDGRALLTTALGQVGTRLLGLNCIPAPITKVAPTLVTIAKEMGATVREIEMEPPAAAMELRGLDFGMGIRENVFVVGMEECPYTIFVRQGWWKMRILEDATDLTPMVTNILKVLLQEALGGGKAGGILESLLRGVL